MEKMIDNRKVGKSVGGIKAKLQKEKPEKTWQGGEMSWKGDGADWKRKGESLTPRRA